MESFYGRKERKHVQGSLKSIQGGFLLQLLQACENKIYLLIQDLFVRGVRFVSLNPHKIEEVIAAIERYQLDFDDAYRTPWLQRTTLPP